MHVANIGGAEIITLYQIISMLETYTNKKAIKRITDSRPTIFIGDTCQDDMNLINLSMFKNGFKKTFDHIVALHHDEKAP